MSSTSSNSSPVMEKSIQKQRYPEARVIVLDDNINTFEHVSNCLERIIPGISKKNHGHLLLK